MKEMNYRDYKSGVKVTFKLHSRCGTRFTKTTLAIANGSTTTRRKAFAGLCECCKYVLSAIWDATYESR